MQPPWLHLIQRVSDMETWRIAQKAIADWIVQEQISADSLIGELAIDIFWLAVIATWPRRGRTIGDIVEERASGVPMTGWAYQMWHEYALRPCLFAANCRRLSDRSICHLRFEIYDAIVRLMQVWIWNDRPYEVSFEFSSFHIPLFRRCTQIWKFHQSESDLFFLPVSPTSL